jgi:hypothetical protein
LLDFLSALTIFVACSVSASISCCVTKWTGFGSSLKVCFSAKSDFSSLSFASAASFLISSAWLETSEFAFCSS